MESFVGSGASDHMVWCEDQLGDIKRIEPREIALGDGNCVTAN